MNKELVKKTGRPLRLLSLGKTHILEKIEQNQPISVYKLHKLLGGSYNWVKAQVRKLTEEGLVSIEVKVNDQNRAERLISIK